MPDITASTKKKGIRSGGGVVILWKRHPNVTHQEEQETSTRKFLRNEEKEKEKEEREKVEITSRFSNIAILVLMF